MKYADVDMQEIPRQMSPLTQVQNNLHNIQDRSHWRSRHSESINNNSGKECPEVIDLDVEDSPVNEKTESPLTVNGVTTTVKKVSLPWQDKKPSDDKGLTTTTTKTESEISNESSGDNVIPKDTSSSVAAETQETDGNKASEGGTFVKKKLIFDENRQVIERTGGNRKQLYGSKISKKSRGLVDLVAFHTQAVLKSCMEGDGYLCEIEEDLIFNFNNEREEDKVQEDEESSSESERDDDISPNFPSSSTSYEVSPMEKLKPEPTMHQKKMAVEFWRSGKKGPLRLETVKHNFRFVTSRIQLHRFQKHILEAGVLKEKYKTIGEHLISRFKAAKEEQLVVHDRDLKQWAVEENKKLELKIPNFKASSTWLWKWKRSNRIVPQKINGIVSDKCSMEQQMITQKAQEVKRVILNGDTQLLNMDQSNIKKEFHSGHTQGYCRAKTVESAAQSVCATTHSNTIQPTVSFEGERKRSYPTVAEDSLSKRPRIEDFAEKESTSVTGKTNVNGLSRQNSKEKEVSVVDLVEEEEEEEVKNEKGLSTEEENKMEVIDTSNSIPTSKEIPSSSSKSLDSSVQPKEPVIPSSSVISVITTQANSVSSPSPHPTEEKRTKPVSAVSSGVPNGLLSQMPSIEVKKVKLCPSLEKKATAMSAADSLSVTPSVTITKTSASSTSVQNPLSISTALSGLVSSQVSSKLSSAESSKELLKECETIISGTNLENKVGLNPAHSLTRKLVKKLTRAELESFLLEMTCDLIFTKSDAGKYRQMYEEMKEISENKTAKIAHLSKQIADLSSVVNRAIIECKEKRDHIPLRLTRSVGLQLDQSNIINAHKARARGDKLHVITPSSNASIATTPSSAQDRTQPQRCNRTVVSSTSKTMPPPTPNGLITSPASKDATPTTPVSNRSPQRQLRALHPRISPNTTQGNALIATSTPNSAQSVTTSESSSNKSPAFIDITERSKINNMGSSINVRRQKPGVAPGIPTSSTGNTANVNPMPANHVMAPTLKVVQPHYGQSGNAYSQPGGAPRVVTTTIPSASTVPGSRLTYLIPSPSAVPVPSRQVLLTPATPQQLRGRPANTPGNTLQTMLMRSNALVQLPSGAITTSSPTLMRTVPTNSQQQIIAKNSQQQNASRVLTLQSRPAPSSRVVSHHPAPLPAQPQPTVVNPNLKPIPRRPVLKLSKVSNGIVLSWNMTMTTPHEEIASYQLYAYQEGANAPPSPALWKKVGDVKALPLPMACTLTQFADGHTYHFAVRAVDVHGRVGEFSVPGTIELFN